MYPRDRGADPGSELPWRFLHASLCFYENWRTWDSTWVVDHANGAFLNWTTPPGCAEYVSQLPLSMLPAWRVLFLVPLSVTLNVCAAPTSLTPTPGFLRCPRLWMAKTLSCLSHCCRSSCHFCSCSLSFLSANHGFVWRSRRMLQKIK